MGFWTTLLSDQQCKNCGSYDTVRIYQDDPEWDEAVDYIYRCGHDGTIKKSISATNVMNMCCMTIMGSDLIRTDK